MIWKTVLLLASFFIFLFLSRTVSAATYYVSPSGSDANPGTQTAPWKTSQKAVSAATAGTTILFRAGTYGTFSITSKNGTTGSPIVLTAFPGEEKKAIFTRNTYESGYGIEIKDSSYIRIENLAITKVQKGIVIARSNNITFTKNYIYDIGMEGVHAQDDSGFLTISDNEIHGLGNISGYLNPQEPYANFSEGVYIGNGSYPGAHNIAFPDTTHDVLIKNNHIYNNGNIMGEGVNIKGEAYNVTIENNRIHDLTVSTGGAITFDEASQSGYEPTRDRNVVVRNNTIYNVKTNSPYADGNCVEARGPKMIIYNNVCWGYQHYGIRIDDKLDQNQTSLVYHNTIVPSGSGVIGNFGHVDIKNNIGPLTSENTPYSDTLFINAAQRDYHLRTGSAAIDKGNAMAIVTHDFDGISRPQGIRYDHGAFEYTSGTSTSPTFSPSTTSTKAPTPTIISKPGDANGDNKVDGIDYIAWLNHYNQTTTNRARDGDFNASGKVDGQDYVIWLNNYNK